MHLAFDYHSDVSCLSKLLCFIIKVVNAKAELTDSQECGWGDTVASMSLSCMASFHLFAVPSLPWSDHGQTHTLRGE